MCEQFEVIRSILSCPRHWTVRYNDDVLFDDDVTEKCNTHGGLKRRIEIDGDISCLCMDGGVVFRLCRSPVRGS